MVWLRDSNEDSVKRLARDAVISRHNWSERSTFMVSNSRDWHGVAGCCWKASNVPHTDLFQDCLSVLTPYSLALTRVSDPSEHGGSVNIFMTQPQKSHTIASTMFFLLEAIH